MKILWKDATQIYCVERLTQGDIHLLLLVSSILYGLGEGGMWMWEGVFPYGMLTGGVWLTFCALTLLDVFKLHSHLSFLWILWFLLHSQKTVLPYCHPYREGDQPSKKALKKQQKQEEKAKRKAETQARLVGASHVCRGKIDSRVVNVHTVPLEVVVSCIVACGPACITHHLSTYYCAHLCISSSTWHIACPFLSLCMSPAGGWGRSKSRRGESHSHGLTVRACCRVASKWWTVVGEGVRGCFIMVVFLFCFLPIIPCQLSVSWLLPPILSFNKHCSLCSCTRPMQEDYQSQIVDCQRVPVTRKPA